MLQKFTHILLALGLLISVAKASAAEQKPNLLIILADDCTYNDLPVYGGKNAKTPNIDRLAAEGLTFNRAYVSSAICQPCRAELYTGQYPMRNGCAWNHSSSREGTRSLPHHLGELGYRVGLAGKSHVLPEASFPFEAVAGYDPNCVRNPTRAHETAGIQEFMSRQGDSPFCLVVALVEPHVPWVMGDASQYPPKKIQLPPNIADTPKTREDFSHYLTEITYMDGQVGEILEVLKKTGREKDTMVIFSSEQGSQFPGNKWTNWDTGLHTALIAKWPNKIKAGQRTDALVQYVDVAPTLVELGGGKPVPDFDGTSFTAVLRGEKAEHRKYAYGMHNNVPEGPSYPVRTISDGQYRYIRNLKSEEIYIEKHLMGGGPLNNPYWNTWMTHSPDKPEIYQLIKRYMRRPAEQLYHTTADAYEMTDLAALPEHEAKRQELSKELDIWLKEQKDPGVDLDTREAHSAAKEGRHKYE